MKQMNQTEALIEAIKQAERLRLLRVAENAHDLQELIEHLKQITDSR